MLSFEELARNAKTSEWLQRRDLEVVAAEHFDRARIRLSGTIAKVIQGFWGRERLRRAMVACGVMPGHIRKDPHPLEWYEGAWHLLVYAPDDVADIWMRAPTEAQNAMCEALVADGGVLDDQGRFIALVMTEFEDFSTGPL